MIEEIWKDIPGFESHYQASNLGRIRSDKEEAYDLFYVSYELCYGVAPW